MKSNQHPTLSEYLLYEASKFLIYPQPSQQRRTKRTVEDRTLVDKIFAELAEERRTFGSLGKINNDPICLDDIYCRELLRAVPEMVRVTLKLRALPSLEFTTNSDPQGSREKPEWWLYLRESANCLRLGLSQASVALARAAVEARLREAYAQLPGNKAYAARNVKFDDLISNLSNLFNLSKGAAGLSPEEESWARCVQQAGNNVLHDRPIDAEEALRVFEAARSMMHKMQEKARL